MVFTYVINVGKLVIMWWFMNRLKTYGCIETSQYIVTCRNFKADNNCLGPCHFIYSQRNKKINQHLYLFTV